MYTKNYSNKNIIYSKYKNNNVNVTELLNDLNENINFNKNRIFMKKLGI